jgi:hypothetical protein
LKVCESFVIYPRTPLNKIDTHITVPKATLK